jgi:hypothetical protein
MLNHIPQIQVIAEGASGNIYVQSAIAGLDFTPADAGGGSAVLFPGTLIYCPFSLPLSGRISVSLTSVRSTTQAA